MRLFGGKIFRQIGRVGRDPILQEIGEVFPPPQRSSIHSEYVALRNGKGGYVTQFARELNRFADRFSENGARLEARYNTVTQVAEIYDATTQRVVLSATASGDGPFPNRIEISILYGREGMREFLEEVLPDKIWVICH